MSADTGIYRLTALLQIHPGELRKAALVAGLFALIELGRSAGGSGADALFFLRFGVDNLPYMFIALGVTNFVFSLSYAAFLGRFRKGRFFVVLLLIMAFLLILERAAIILDFRALYPILWLTINIIGALLGTLLWNTAGEVCDARQAKRLFPLFVSAGLLGGLLGSVLIGPIARLFGTENLLVMYIVLLLLGSVLIRTIAQEFFKPTPKYKSSFLADIRAGYDVVRNSAMLQLLAVSAVLFSVLYFSVSFPFGQAVSRSFTNEADVAGFLGLFSGVTGVLTFLVSLFVANRLYARIGVVNALLLLPITYLLGFVLFAVNFTLTSAAIVRLSQLLVMNGVGDAAYGTFFNVVPMEKRAQVRAFDSGVPSQIGTILSGVLLILGARVLNTSQIFIMGIVVALVCTYTIWQMRQRYAAALVAALRAGRYEVFTTGQNAFSSVRNDANAIQVASAALHDSKSTTRRLAIEMLARMNARSAIPSLIQSLSDSDVEVRRDAVRALGDFQAWEALESIGDLLKAPEPMLRQSALVALPKLQPHRSIISAIAPLLRDPEPTVRMSAALALVQLGHVDEALPAIERLLQDFDPTVRVLALNASSQLADNKQINFDPALVRQALTDGSPVVRRAACEALGHFDQIAAQDALIDCLNDNDSGVRMAAATALKRMGEKVTPRLFTLLKSESAQVREAALTAFTPQKLSPPLRDYAQRELNDLRQWQTLADAIPPAGRASKLLREALESEIVGSEQRLLQLIGVLGNPETMALVGKGLTMRDEQTRAAAVEALDTLGDKQLSKQLIALIESPQVHRPPGLPVEAAISRLIAEDGQDDGWLRALAIYVSGEKGLRSLIPELHLLTNESDPLVCEAACDALAQLGEVRPMKTLQTVSLMERILFLHEVPLFAGLSPDDLKQIADVAHEQLYSNGTILCKEGDEGHEMFIIVSGSTRILKAEANANQLLAVRKVGDFIGEMAIIEAGPRSATAQADGETRVLVIDGNTFKGILRDRPEVSFAVLQALSRRLREKT